MNDLDWADRETVLRLLFSKMNTGESAGCWREAPTGTSRQNQRSQGSKQTSSDVRGANQDLNRGFREEDNDDYGGEGNG